VSQDSELHFPKRKFQAEATERIEFQADSGQLCAERSAARRQSQYVLPYMVTCLIWLSTDKQLQVVVCGFVPSETNIP
jgi:hypothetical protein